MRPLDGIEATDVLHVRLPADVKATAVGHARRRGLSLSSFVRQLIIDEAARVAAGPVVVIPAERLLNAALRSEGDGNG